MKQITVVTDNKKGMLAKITGVLESQGINIEDIQLHATTDVGITYLTVDDVDKALASLAAVAMTAIPMETLLIQIENRPGALAVIARELTQNDLDIRSLSLIEPRATHSLAAVVTDDNPKAAQVLSQYCL